MSTWLLAHWYLSLAISAIYTIASVWWSVRIERKVRELRRVQRVHDYSIRYTAEDQNRFETYVLKRLDERKGA